MSDKTYIQLNTNSVSTIQLNIWKKTTGESFSPSGAYYTIKGSAKDNIVIAKTLAGNKNNQIWANITQTVTASAAEYDVIWEIRRYDKNITNHYTKLLVSDE